MIRARVLVLVAPLVFTAPVASGQCPKEDVKGSRLGEVVASVLNLRAFQSVNGAEWELLEGQAIQDADLLLLAQEEPGSLPTLPDARGVFLRGKNNGRSAKAGGAAYGEVPVGTFKGDTIASHTHPGNDGDIFRAFKRGRPFVPGNSGGDTTTGGGIRNADFERTGPFGADETMPRHTVVNFYVKARLACR